MNDRADYARSPRSPHFVARVAAKARALALILAVASTASTALAAADGGQRAVRAAHVAAIQGAGATGVQIQNLDFVQTATATIQFYGRTGAPIELTRIIPPGTAANVYLPSVPGLANGAYAMVVTADRPIAALARTDWESTRAAGIYSNVEPGTTVVLPLVVADYYGQTSIVSIQNTDTAATQVVHVEALGMNGVAARVAVDRSVAPGSAITIDFERDADFSPLRSAAAHGFLGWMKVTSGAEVAVQSFIDVTTSQRAVYAFEGVPERKLANDLIAPLIRKRQSTIVGRYDTGIAVVNPGASAATVRVHYDGSTGTCAGQSFDEAPVTVPAGDGRTIYQGTSTALPDGCVASARVSADAPIAAVVLDAMNLTEQGAAYTAVPLADAARRTVLPLVRRNHTALRLSTGIQITNPGDDAAHVEVAFASDTGAPLSTCGAACQVVIAPHSSRTMYPSVSLNAMPAGTYGSAVVTSDRPVVALVNDISENNSADAATYIGLPAGDPAPSASGALAGPLGAGLGLGIGVADRGGAGAGRWRAYLAVGR